MKQHTFLYSTRWWLLLSLVFLLPLWLNAQRTVHITHGECFVDTDPGAGNAMPLLAEDGNFNDAFEKVITSLTGISAGNHSIGIRVKDAENHWSPVFRSTLSVMNLRTIQLSQAEYFIDNDPGEGSASPMIAFDNNFNEAFEKVAASLSNLGQGNHTIGIRVKDVENHWSPAFKSAITVINLRTIQLNQAEYYMDVNPAQGSGSPMLAFNNNFSDAFETVTASLSNLTAGNHVIGIRVKDPENHWSPDFKSAISVMSLRTIKLNQAEYYVDVNPAQGSGSPMLAFNNNFSDAFETVTATLSNLSAGNHVIGIRVMDAENHWSPDFKSAISVMSLRTIKLNQAEYYVDVNPAQGSGSLMLAFNNNFSEAFETVTATLSNLSAGNHVIGIRVMDAENHWSPDFKSAISVMSLRTIKLNQAEYYWDADPGQGNGTPMIAFDGTYNDAYENSTATIPGAPPGVHKLSMRVKDEEGNWSPPFSQAVVVSWCDTIHINASATSICSGTNITFTASYSSLGGTPSFQWKLNGASVGGNTSAYSNNSLANGDVVTCQLTTQFGCLAGPQTSNSIAVVVGPSTTPTITISPNPSGAICSGTSVTFTATPTNGGTTPAYQWKVNGANTGANSPAFTSASLVNG
ncbi:MAG: hypothetical protein NTZ16_16265, partial [Verrucomicrobia bacterium]|nr:hypothetical protein [Verrucomicrobiota bacterium]